MANLGQSEKITTVNNEEVIFTTSDGQPLRMNKSDLAEVIRQAMTVVTTNKNGLMGKDGFIFRGPFDYNKIEVINSLINSGIYIHGDIMAGTLGGFGILIVFNASPYVVQLDLAANGVASFRFSANNGGLWRSWMKINFT